VAKEVSKEDTRKRVVESLEHLGHQKLSNEPGGYDLRGWLKSLKTLLNDFEVKVGKSSLSEEFQSKRKEIEAQFSKGASSAQIDEEIEAVRKEENDIRNKLKEESERIASRLSAIGGEKTGKTQELEQEKLKLKKVEEERKSVSFFSRLIGNSGPSKEPFEKKVKDLENDLKMLEEETVNLQAVRKSIDGVKSAAAGIYEDLWKRLGDIETKLNELEAAKEARKQLAKEREDATDALRKLITELKLKEESEEV
jgi:chromosome segregation ATPase